MISFLNRIPDWVLYLGISILVFILTFPVFEPDYNVGLDASFSWAINYLFANDYQQALSLFYTYGVFGFIKKPIALSYNFEIALLFYSLVKITAIYHLFKLFFQETKGFVFLLIILISAIVNLDLILTLFVILNLFKFIQSNKVVFLLIPIGLTSLVLFIKPSIFFSCIGLIGGSIIFQAINKGQIKNVGIYLILILATFIIFSFIIASDGFYFLKYIIRVYYITTGYTDALTLFPDNNCLYLSLFFICLGGSYIFLKEKVQKQMFLLLLIPLWGAWKYGMIREDFAHYKYLIDTSIIVFGILVLFENKLKERTIIIILGVVAIFSLISNIKNIDKENRHYKISLNGIHNVSPWIFTFDNNKEQFIKKSEENISQKILPQKIKEKINGRTLDVFPWELTYIPANQLNWKPRNSLQSLFLSKKHEEIASKELNRTNGPELILFHWKKDSMNGSFGCVDYRHLFNDGPNTLYEIFNNYNFTIGDNKVGLFEKNNENNFLPPKTLFSQKVAFNEWIQIPKYKEGYLRVKTNVGYNILGKIKSMLYKGEAFFIEYYLSDNDIRKYRFIPSIAESGLWVSPLFENLQFDIEKSKVKKIRFSTSNDSMIKETIFLEWEEIPMKNNLKTLSSIFQVDKNIN